MNVCQPSLDEEWRLIEAWPHYEVSSLGRVRRCAPGKRTRIGLVLKPKLAGNKKAHRRYWAVCLRHENRKATLNVHVLVCEAFHGRRPLSHPKMHAAHVDGDRSNNRSSNVAWATPKENEEHKLNHGRRARGERQGASKLTEPQVKAIRQLFDRGADHGAIAREFSITAGYVRTLGARRSWRHVQ